jgi:uncharacterized protein
VNASPDVQLRLLDLQALDTTLDQLDHRKRGLPEHLEVERLTARLGELGDLIVGAETEDGDIGREQTKAEGDVDQVVQRAERDQKRLDAGQVSSPKELESLQSELASLARRRSELEDIVLDVMERREAVQARLAEFVAEREQLTKELAEVSERRDDAVIDIDAEVDKARSERAALATEIPFDLITLYEKVREQHGGVGAARLHRGRCEGCHLNLDARSLEELRKAPDDEVVRCEECRRILVRTNESGL